MTLYLWIDEMGEWRVAHLPPSDEENVVVIALSDGTSAAFFNRADMTEIEVTVR